MAVRNFEEPCKAFAFKHTWLVRVTGLHIAQPNAKTICCINRRERGVRRFFLAVQNFGELCSFWKVLKHSKSFTLIYYAKNSTGKQLIPFAGCCLNRWLIIFSALFFYNCFLPFALAGLHFNKICACGKVAQR